MLLWLLCSPWLMCAWKCHCIYLCLNFWLCHLWQFIINLWSGSWFFEFAVPENPKGSASLTTQHLTALHLYCNCSHIVLLFGELPYSHLFWQLIYTFLRWCVLFHCNFSHYFIVWRVAMRSSVLIADLHLFTLVCFGYIVVSYYFCSFPCIFCGLRNKYWQPS